MENLNCKNMFQNIKVFVSAQKGKTILFLSTLFLLGLLFFIKPNSVPAAECKVAHTCDEGGGVCAGGNASIPCNCDYGGTATCDVGTNVVCSTFTCEGADVCNKTLCNPAPTCTIDSFTCTGANPDLVWKTTNCTSVSIDNTVGNNLSAVGTYTPAKFSTTYTITADGKKSQATCPTPNPALNAVWQENNGKSISKTVTPGSSISVPLNFSNTGQRGSQIKNTSCDKGSVSGISPSDVSAACDNTTLIVP